MISLSMNSLNISYIAFKSCFSALVTLRKINEIYKRIHYTKILVFHDELAHGVGYDMALGNISDANDDYETNRNFEQEGPKDY